jgi:nucleoside-diphosphate-sugar epimerase
MRILLTGATGFIGSQVARVLAEGGDEVHALVRPESKLLARLDDIREKVRIVSGDLSRVDDLSDKLARVEADACIHMAWYVAPGEYLTSPRNTEFLASSIRLATIMADSGCKRFVGAGTNFEYANDAGWLSEESPTRPNSLYAASKLALFHVLEQMAILRDIRFAWARIFYQYGPEESEKRLVPAVILPLLRGQEARVTAGEQVRDFLHVSDVARAIVAIAKSDLRGAVNVASGKPITVRDMCLTIEEIVREGAGGGDAGGGEKRGRLALGAIPYRQGDPMFVCANVGKLRSVGFTPRFDLRAGLVDTVAWWRSRLPEISR